jgi:hypothetical protein
VELLDRSSQDDFVINFKALEWRLNNEYNLVLLLGSGKRVFLDLTVDGLRKNVTYQPPPLYSSKSYSEAPLHVTMESHILEDTFYTTFLYTNNSFYCSMVRDEFYADYEAVYRLNV